MENKNIFDEIITGISDGSIVSNKKIQQIKDLLYTDFTRFITDKNYADRSSELYLDMGNNNAIQSVCKILDIDIVRDELQEIRAKKFLENLRK